ncbi:aminoglycoside phosphotransferase family protein [Virgibacillus sp. 6R]|uniref:aminoglycoside phosphotransferase family protein n=1 Tax=Metabacillus sp. 22489 TaxID=3453928 RepID=UPI0011A21987
MDAYKYILSFYYGINMIDIKKQQGGWAALAYEVSDGTKKYFLKVYEKSRASTRKWASLIEQYAPILVWLNENSRLSGKIPILYITKNGNFKCEDEENIYLLYDYINGETIGDQDLTKEQIQQLTQMIVELHHYGEEVVLDKPLLKEDFSVPFLEQLRYVLNEGRSHLSHDVKKLIDNYNEQLKEAIFKVEQLSKLLKASDLKMALCHTDLHYWNLIKSEQLMLIDWEGLKLAPVEADLMFLVEKPYFEEFMEIYQKAHKNYAINDDALSFYQKRRRLEDIWEFIEQLLYDDQEGQERVETINYLKNELKRLREY